MEATQTAPRPWSPMGIPSYAEWIRRKTAVTTLNPPLQQQHEEPQQQKESPDAPPILLVQEEIQDSIPSFSSVSEISPSAPQSCARPSRPDSEDSCATLVEHDEREQTISPLKRKRCDDEELLSDRSENVTMIVTGNNESWDVEEEGLEGVIETTTRPQEDSTTTVEAAPTDKAMQAQIEEEALSVPAESPSKRVKVEKGYPYARNLAWTLGSAAVGAVLGVAAVGIFC
ncbi:hypothetical protein BC830DRAFT_1115859 [Chytriomyces sp. MP71]|nr:hypothetical protein BC830DRAFT_1115859 [Chytriomyces sp. MP71]